jgi:hypothetical protein
MIAIVVPTTSAIPRQTGTKIVFQSHTAISPMSFRGGPYPVECGFQERWSRPTARQRISRARFPGRDP